MDFVSFAKTVFYICMIPLVFFSIKFWVFGIVAPLFHSKKNLTKDRDLLTVTVQIPVYNDPIAVRCIQDCLNFDYPKDKHEVVVVDDSDDETSEILEKFQKRNKKFKLIKRDSRKGFKAGALNEISNISKGEIIVIFDSDYRPNKDFLKEIVRPFEDGKVAFVQSRWGYLNSGRNLISKISMITYNAFHKCSMPVKEKMGTAIFCGSGGAIRKKVLIELGGWNEDSITEDLDISIRALNKGYKQVYLSKLMASGEVPTSLKSFIRQQQRWAYGTTKAMKDYMSKIITSKKLTKLQKLDLLLITSGFLVFPFILGVTISTSLISMPWFNPAVEIPTTIPMFVTSVKKFFYGFYSLSGIGLLIATSGFFFECLVGLLMGKKYRYIFLIPLIYALGFIIQITNSIVVFKALLGFKHKFYRTPKKEMN